MAFRFGSDQALYADTTNLWHKRLGYSSRQITFKGIAIDTRINKECEVCHEAKQTRSSFPVSFNKAEYLFQLIHCELWELYQIKSISGAYYFLMIVDDYNRGVWLYLLREKSEAKQRLMNLCNLI